MKEVDYLIVGFGIAAACFAKKCVENNKSFHVIADLEPKASMIAAGMFNPIILFRFTTVHRAIEHMELLKKTFGEFEQLLDTQVIHNKKIYRIFANERETKIWQKKISKKPILQKYLNPEIIYKRYDNINAPHGFGEVYSCGWVDMQRIIESFVEQFKIHFSQERFAYDDFNPEKLQYKNMHAKHVIFAEGVGVEDNPFFSFVPIIKNKGETLIIETKAPLPDIIFKSKNFLMPLTNNRYYIGATYDRDWSTPNPTEEKKLELINKLETYFTGDYDIVEHRAAFRPTLDDRRGVIGNHEKYNNLYILNGMGTRGTFHAPSMSHYLFDYIEREIPFPPEYNVQRYQNLT